MYIYMYIYIYTQSTWTYFAPIAELEVPESAIFGSPQVFREGSNDGYGFLDAPVKLQGVCSCSTAMIGG